MVGSYCAVPGCTASSSKCRGLSFHAFPKTGVNDAWRAMLIHKIARADAGFNPNNATICSRHFKDDCFKYGPSHTRRHLIPGSLPTEFMPVRPQDVAPQPSPRKRPSGRSTPRSAEKVVYYTFSDVGRDARMLYSPWCLLQDSPTTLTVGMVQDDVVRIKVTVTQDFTARVSVYGFPAPKCTCSIVKVKLSKFLHDLSSAPVCPGVTSFELQRYADLPSGGDREIFFRHVFYHHGELAGVTHSSCVRSTKCDMILPPCSHICKSCADTEKLLLAKHKRAAESLNRPIHKYNQITTMSREMLAHALNTTRRREQEYQEQFGNYQAQEYVPGPRESSDQISNSPLKKFKRE